MAVQKILAKTQDSLQAAEHVTHVDNVYIQQAIQDLIDTLEHEQQELDKIHPGRGAGVGLASNQIEYPCQPISATDLEPAEGYYPKDFKVPHLYVISIRPERAATEKCDPIAVTVYINSELTPLSDTQTKLAEGCLSITGITGYKVARFTKINVKAINREGEALDFEAQGFLACVHQHETDHCRGEEYLNMMDLGKEEIEAAIEWIETHTAPEKNTWIIADKLQCTGDHPDLTALSVWLDNQLNALNPSMSLR